MSFPSSGRSSSRDRSWQSGDEILQEMLQNMKKKNRDFFDARPKWRDTAASSFPVGFPFNEEINTQPSAGGSKSKLEARLAEIAQRHPELTENLYGFIPDEQKPGVRFPEGPKREDKLSSATPEPQATDARATTTTQGTQTGLGSDSKLRNTVPDMQASAQYSSDSVDGDRGQRSQSAPPQSPGNGKQKEEGPRVIPIRTDSPSGLPHPSTQIPPQYQQQSGYYPPPPQQFQQPPPPQQQYYQEPGQHHFQDQQRHPEDRAPTVRHIPIFVEGRDEPILPRDVGTSTPGMKRGGCQGKSEAASGKRGPPPEEKRQQQQQQAPQQQQQSQAHPQQAPAPPYPPPKPDSLVQVAEVVKEVEYLTVKVNEWNGKSRTDKEYVYLDEMLTRNLLKLDNIETEGKEEVRSARKDAIRRIQEAISILEVKADENKGKNKDTGEGCGLNRDKMEIDEPLQQSPSIESSESTSQNPQLAHT